MSHTFVLVACMCLTLSVKPQSITHTWKASAVNMYGTYYDIAGAETPDAINTFYNSLKEENGGEPMSDTDSAQSVLAYMLMMEYAAGITISFDTEGLVKYTGHIVNKKELHSETGRYKLKGSTIKTTLKKSKKPDFEIIALNETELVLNGVLGSDKFTVKFVRVD